MTTNTTQPFEHDENMQAFEKDGKILVAVVDETYGKSEDDDWERDRERFRIDLEHEFGLRFEDGNVGPGADLPAFITLLQTEAHVPVWVLALLWQIFDFEDSLFCGSMIHGEPACGGWRWTTTGGMTWRSG